ncbi:DUF6273 domain-containing protein [Vagococcus xieshaowenii]|uniref:DUF6273 domain-containing protein n=1 Tax=Vagococcus xieshaowenii TaxID=2562451 RepID=A0A4Z0D1M5_9ENTE|nr:DUF6273 domain-containing protein [Vagococcus xieshaowenii]QCA27904.1 hypothetical protein E4Z98_00485 [Vagococcus xieshaowenii]TFZ39417.1 hypothetical protein E4031_08905 [Vagococcus xieshaowenii]
MRAKTIVTASLLACTLCHSYEQTTATETTNLQADIHKLAKDTDDTNIAGFIVVPKEITLEKNGNMVENQEIPLHYYPMSENDSDVTISSTSHVVELKNQANQDEIVSLPIFNSDNDRLTEGSTDLVTLSSSDPTKMFALRTTVDAFPSEEIYTGTMTFESTVQVVTDITWEIDGASELQPASTATYQLIPHPATSRSTPETVTWSVENKNSEETKIDEKTGELTIGLDENEGTLTITATPEDGESYTKEVTVKPLLKGDEFTYDGIEWTVMKREATQALIVTKDVVGDGFGYNEEKDSNNSYEDSTLKEKATAFYNQRSDYMKTNYVLPVTISSGDSVEVTTVNGNEEDKQAFALSLGDIYANWTTQKERTVGKDWWLRTKVSSLPNTVYYIQSDGSLNDTNLTTGKNEKFLRPALYIKQGEIKEKLKLKHLHVRGAKPTHTVNYQLSKDENNEGQFVGQNENVEFTIHEEFTTSDKTAISDNGELTLGLNEQQSTITVQATHNGQTVEKHVDVLPLEEGEVINIDGLDWRVLKIDETTQQALLITEYVQGNEGIVFNEEEKGNIYQGSNLEAQMHAFYENQVSDTIKHHALPVNLPIDSERAHGDEVSNQTSVASEGEPTAFALSGADKMSIFGENHTEAIAYVDDEAKEKEDAKHWWLRTKAESGSASPAAYRVNHIGRNVSLAVQGEISVTPYLRPAVYVHLGSETYEPWTITGQDAVIKGDKKVAYHMVSNELNPTDMNLTWGVYYATSKGTMVNENGELTVASNETATTITVVATNGKQTARKDIRVEPQVAITKATVTNGEDEGLDIITEYQEAIQGETIQFESNFPDELKENIVWKVPSESNPNLNPNTKFNGNVLTIGTKELSTTIKVIAVSRYNPANYAKFDLTVTPKLEIKADIGYTISVLSTRSFSTNLDAEFSLDTEIENEVEHLDIKADPGLSKKITINVLITALQEKDDFTVQLNASHTSKNGRQQVATKSITINLFKVGRSVTLGNFNWKILDIDNEGNYFMIMSELNQMRQTSFSLNGYTSYEDSELYKFLETIENEISGDIKKYIQPINLFSQGEEDITKVDVINGEKRLFPLTKQDYLKYERYLPAIPGDSMHITGWSLRTSKGSQVYFVEFDRPELISPNSIKYVRPGVIFNFGY